MTPDEVADLAAMLQAVVPEAPRLGLRERKKLTAMRRIQRVALEQFGEHGFDAVTIEHIAEHAEVSASSIYRYFGTKEGLVLHDEYDDHLLSIVHSLLAEHDIHTAFEIGLTAMLETHLTMSDDRTIQRVALWLEVPSIRSAGFNVLDDVARDIGTTIHQAHPDTDPTQCRAVASSLIFPVFTVLEDWFQAGAQGDMVTPLLEVVRALRPATPFGSPAESSPGADDN